MPDPHDDVTRLELAGKERGGSVDLRTASGEYRVREGEGGTQGERG